MQIDTFDDGGCQIGHVTVDRTPFQPPTKGHRWRLRTSPLGCWANLSGVYEWCVSDVSAPTKPLATYIGKATRFGDRLPMYWRDMSPQLVEHLEGFKPLTSRGLPRMEKNRLRWVHFWLAWAYVNQKLVTLRLSKADVTALEIEEGARISSMSKHGRLLNKECLGSGSVYVDDVVACLRKANGCPSNIPIPPNWTFPIDVCVNARPWVNAIGAWSENRKP